MRYSVQVQSGENCGTSEVAVLAKVSATLTQSGGGGEDAFGEGIPETLGSLQG